MKNEVKFTCKPIKATELQNDKISTKLDVRQKWICTIKGGIYETVRNNITLKLAYDEFYNYFKT